MTEPRARPTKTLFVLPALHVGGAERATLNLIRSLDRRRFAPALALVRENGALGSGLPDGLPTFALGRRRMRYAVPALGRLLVKEQPDLVFAVLEHTSIAVLLAQQWARVRAPVVCNVQIALSRQLAETPVPARWALRAGVSRLYGRAAAVVALSRGAAEDFSRLFPHLAGRLHVVYNPVVDERLAQLAREPVAHPWLGAGEPVVLACGRLVRQKGFDLLLRALAELRRQRPARLIILGDGPERAPLERLAAELGLSGSVDLPGLEANPFRYMARADAFVLASRWEGLANVLIEAMACGAPVVAADCVAGPSEIIRHGVDGLLVPPEQPAALAQAVRMLLENRALARRFADEGRRSAQRFEAGAIARQYEALLDELAAARRP